MGAEQQKNFFRKLFPPLDKQQLGAQAAAKLICLTKKIFKLLKYLKLLLNGGATCCALTKYSGRPPPGTM